MSFFRDYTEIGENLTEDNPYTRPSYPVLMVISGPSGVGKDTVALELIRSRPNRFHFVVTATTRPPRNGEIHGVDYFFFSNDEFAQMIEDDEFLEYAIVYNDFKGVPKSQIREALASGKDVVMRVDVQGAATIRKLIPTALFVFLTAESEDALVQRLIARNSESPDDIKLRLATMRQELKRADEFDYWVVNAEGKVEEAVDKLLAIIEAQRCRRDQTPIEI